MTYRQRVAVDEIMRGAPLDIGGEVSEQRAIFDQLVAARPLAGDVVASLRDLDGVPVIDISVAGVSGQRTILYSHGGAYALGSAASAIGLASDLVRHTRRRAVAVDYRLAPEHPFPEAIEGALTAYRPLLGEGVSSERIAFAGESAGDGFAAATIVSLRGRGDRAAEVCRRPVALGGPVARRREHLYQGPARSHSDGRRAAARARDYLAGADLGSPPASPIFANLTGFPPMLIQAGSHEILLDDVIRLAAHAAACDVEITLEVTPFVPHVFQRFAAILDEGQAALARVGDSLSRHFAASDPRTHSPQHAPGRVSSAGAEKRRS